MEGKEAMRPAENGVVDGCLSWLHPFSLAFTVA